MSVNPLLSLCILALSVGMSVQEVNKSSFHYLTSNKKSIHNQLEATTEHSEPPPKNETAKMARYIVHYSDWCILAHISRHGNTSGFPAGRVYSTADGFMEGSTGTPYFYVSRLDAHINDLSKDSRCSVTMSLAERDYCYIHELDPEDPRCAQVILTGNFVFLVPESSEAQKAKRFLFKRHPVMESWPKGHNWQVGKVKISYVQVLDNFGGSAYPSVQEYFEANP